MHRSSSASATWVLTPLTGSALGLRKLNRDRTNARIRVIFRRTESRAVCLLASPCKSLEARKTAIVFPERVPLTPSQLRASLVNSPRRPLVNPSVFLTGQFEGLLLLLILWKSRLSSIRCIIRISSASTPTRTSGYANMASKAYTFAGIDAFTSVPFSGNPAAVLILQPGHGLSDERFQLIAAYASPHCRVARRGLNPGA